MGEKQAKREAAKLAREHRRNLVQDLRFRGLSYRKIAKALSESGVTASYVTVKRDLDGIIRDWAEERIADQEASRDEKRQMLLFLWREAWQQYERSKREERVKRRKGERTKPSKDMRLVISKGGKGNGQGDLKPETETETWTEESRETRLGDPAYLEIMRKLADQIAKLDGCYPPSRRRIEGTVGVSVSAVRDDPLAALPPDQRREAIRELLIAEQRVRDKYLGNGEAIDVPVIEHKEGKR